MGEHGLATLRLGPWRVRRRVVLAVGGAGAARGGHEVFTPTLTGLGSASTSPARRSGWRRTSQDVVNVLEYEDLTGVVLVGWSYGGMVVAGVADRVPERIAHLVYFDSDVPRDGDTSVPPGVHSARE